MNPSTHTDDQADQIYLRFMVKPADDESATFEATAGYDEYIIGRKDKTGATENRLNINDKYLSRQHCRVFRNGDDWMVEDLKSANGTRKNGQPVSEPIAIGSGVVLQLGTSMVYIAPATETPPSSSTPNQNEKPSGFRKPDLFDDSAVAEIADDDNTELDNLEHPDDDEEDATVAEEASNFDDSDSTEISTPKDLAPPPITSPAQEDINDVTDPCSSPHALEANEEVACQSLPGMAKTLVKKGYLDLPGAQALLDEARSSGKTFFRILTEKRASSFLNEIYLWASDHYGFELITDENEIFDNAISTKWLSIAQSQQRGIIALQEETGTKVRYAAADPFDLTVRDWISSTVKLPTEPVLADSKALHSALDRLKNSQAENEGEIGLDTINISTEEEVAISEHLGEVETPQMVNFFLHRASMEGASDIHVEPTEDRLNVRMRVNGILYEERSLPASYQQEIISRLKIMAGMNVAEKRRPQDGRLSVVIRGKPIDVRVSTYPTVHGEKIVMRLLDKSALRPSPEHLGLIDRDLRLLKDKLQAPYGLIMISGPTGSGKTTTLYSCLGSINKDEKNVLTVEDPVEYQMNGVYQMQVNSKIGLSFASGLRTILRQDPDVIMVGECRDPETAGMAIQASLTGHIVFSTIHTNDAVGVVTRLIDMDIEPFLVSTALSLAIAQRLVREICPHCRTRVTGDEILNRLQKDGISHERLIQLDIDIDPELDYVEGAGCKQCRQTGYGGRRAVFEVFEITDEARALIVSKDFTDGRLRDLAHNSGMTTLIGHGLQLVEDEITTFSEVIRVLGESS